MNRLKNLYFQTILMKPFVNSQTISIKPFVILQTVSMKPSAISFLKIWSSAPLIWKIPLIHSPCHRSAPQNNTSHLDRLFHLYQRLITLVPTICTIPLGQEFLRLGRARLKTGENSLDQARRVGIILLLLSLAGDGIWTERRIGMTRVSDLSNPHRCAWVSGGSGEVIGVSGRNRLWVV
jgi:hypothetical protein